MLLRLCRYYVAFFRPLSLSLSLSLSLFLSLALSFFLSPCLFLSFFLSLSLSFFLSDPRLTKPKRKGSHHYLQISYLSISMSRQPGCLFFLSLFLCLFLSFFLSLHLHAFASPSSLSFSARLNFFISQFPPPSTSSISSRSFRINSIRPRSVYYALLHASTSSASSEPSVHAMILGFDWK